MLMPILTDKYLEDVDLLSNNHSTNSCEWIRFCVQVFGGIQKLRIHCTKSFYNQDMHVIFFKCNQHRALKCRSVSEVLVGVCVCTHMYLNWITSVRAYRTKARLHLIRVNEEKVIKAYPRRWNYSTLSLCTRKWLRMRFNPFDVTSFTAAKAFDGCLIQTYFWTYLRTPWNNYYIKYFTCA